ncbi:hypothetical protein VNI00_006214 [Paramarasmius palmivorus]|uniref:Uncharacterized protein n=1 Tax=Paramarasmius palmivorus TaxID=297713 RepID=A0AAW0D5Q0_9AGAR
MDICRIPSNTGVSGIGVRVATYIQACTAFIIALLALAYRPRDVNTESEHRTKFRPKLKDTVVASNITLCIVSISVVVSAFIVAFNDEGGLTVYHGLITRNILQLNVLSLLWIAMSYGVVHVQDYVNFRLNFQNQDTSQSAGAQGPRSSCRTFWLVVRDALPFFIAGIVTGSFGIWFWSDQSRFERYSEGSTCIPQTMYWFFVPLDSHDTRIRIFFLVNDALLALPITSPLGAILLSIVAVLLAIALDRLVFGSTSSSLNNKVPKRPFRGVSLACAVYIFIMAFYIYSTEQTIRLNQGVLEDGDEKIWGYGQVLALVAAMLTAGKLVFDFCRSALEKNENSGRSGEDKDERFVL